MRAADQDLCRPSWALESPGVVYVLWMRLKGWCGRDLADKRVPREGREGGYSPASFGGREVGGAGSMARALVMAVPGVYARPNARWLAGNPQTSADSAMPTRKLSQEAHQNSRHRMLRN
jgi:hypothetical protein